MSVFEGIRAERKANDGGLGFRLQANPIVKRRGRMGTEFRARQGRAQAHEEALGIQVMKFGPDLKAIGGPHFLPDHGPAGMRLVRMAELGHHECRWGLEVEGRTLFCGLPNDPAPADSLRTCYCPHHGALVGGGFPDDKAFKPQKWMR